MENNNFKISLNKIENESLTIKGYSPFLCHNVENLDETIYKLISLGGTLDGPIKYPIDGKIASLRSPDNGVMIGLYEPFEK